MFKAIGGEPFRWQRRGEEAALLPRRLGRLCWLLVVLSIACGDATVSYEPPIVPVEFSVSTDGSIRVSAGVRFVTPLGVIGVAGGVSRDTVDQNTEKGLVVIFHQTINGKARETAYLVQQGHPLRVELNGSFVEEFRRNEVMIEVQPGDVVKVTVSSNPAGAHSSTTPPVAQADSPYLGVVVTSQFTIRNPQSGALIASGLVVGSLDPNGPAAQAGIQQGDVLVTVDGEATSNGAEFLHALGNLKPGEAIQVDIYRRSPVDGLYRPFIRRVIVGRRLP